MTYVMTIHENLNELVTFCIMFQIINTSQSGKIISKWQQWCQGNSKGHMAMVLFIDTVDQ